MRHLVCAVLLVLALLLGGSLPVRADESWIQAYQELNEDLRQWYGEAMCSRNLHVVVALDESGSMQSSTLLRNYFLIWEKFLQYGFVAGDRFTFIPFHDVVGAVEPRSRDYSAEDSLALNSWFQAPANLQLPDSQGTALFQAQAETLRVACKEAEKDRQRAVLVLIFGDSPTTDVPEAGASGSEVSAAKELVELLPRFLSQTGSESQGQERKQFRSKSYTLTVAGGDSSKSVSLVVNSALEGTWRQKTARTPQRRVWQPSVRQPLSLPSRPPARSKDPRSGYLAGALLCLAGVLGSLASLRFEVLLESESLDPLRQRKNLSLFQGLRICAQDGSRRPASNEAFMKVVGATGNPAELLDLRWNPLSHIDVTATKDDNRTLLDAGGVSVQKVSLPSGRPQRLRIGLHNQATDLLGITATHWFDLNRFRLLLAGLALLGAIVLVTLTLNWAPPPRIDLGPARPPAVTAVPFCQ